LLIIIYSIDDYEYFIEQIFWFSVDKLIL
jgi:hypothetical protein